MRRNVADAPIAFILTKRIGKGVRSGALIMIAASWGVVAIVAQSVLGWGGTPDPGLISCDLCGVENSAILAQMARLQTCPRWKEREHAAHVLRKIDWRCHPEVVEALAFALLHDREEEVREEAAQSLTKMAPCLPVAHEALSRAADRDPDRSTRRWARKALRTLDGCCEGPCKVCGTTVVGSIAPVLRGPEILKPAPQPGAARASRRRLSRVSSRLRTSPRFLPSDRPPSPRARSCSRRVPPPDRGSCPRQVPSFRPSRN